MAGKENKLFETHPFTNTVLCIANIFNLEHGRSTFLSLAVYGLYNSHKNYFESFEFHTEN